MEEFSKEKFYEDIIYMFGVIKEHHPNLYYKISEEELNSLIEKYMKDESIDTLDKSLYYLYGIMVRIGDSHTKLIPYYIPSNNFKFAIINKECIVSEAVNQNLIGATLVKINDIDINKIINELRGMIVPRTEEGIISSCEDCLSNKIILSILPSIYSSKDIKYTLNKDGKEYTIKESISNVNLDNNIVESKNYYYKIINNIIYIKYLVCRNIDNYPFEKMINEISKIEGMDGYIVDIRGNCGGNSELIKPLIIFLKGKKVITLIDKKVFSSGIFALKNMKNIGSLVIGTDIAEKINGFGDIREDITPNYELEFIYSTKYFTFINNRVFSLKNKKEYDEFFSKEENKKYLEPIYLHPDIYSSITKEDIINGTDSVIDLAIETLNKEIKSDKRK